MWYTKYLDLRKDVLKANFVSTHVIKVYSSSSFFSIYKPPYIEYKISKRIKTLFYSILFLVVTHSLKL